MKGMFRLNILNIHEKRFLEEIQNFLEKKAQIENWNKIPNRKRDIKAQIKKGNKGPNRKKEIKFQIKYGKEMNRMKKNTIPKTKM